MYDYYSTDKIRNLSQYNQVDSNGINSRPMNSSPSTPIPNSNRNKSNQQSFFLNSNNKNCGFSSPTKPQFNNNINNNHNYNHYGTGGSTTSQFQHHHPINKKPPKFKISYSVKNTLNNTIVPDRHCFGVNSLAYDHKKSILYSAGRDSTIKSYHINGYSDEYENDIETDGNEKSEYGFKFKKSYNDHIDWVNDLFFNDDNILVSCSSDSTIKIWNTDSERCLNSLKFHDDYVKVLAYAPKVNYFASSGLDSHIKIWDLSICSISQSFSIDNNNSNINDSNNNHINNDSQFVNSSINKHITSNSQPMNNCNINVVNGNVNISTTNNSNNYQINTPIGSENTTETSDNEDSKDDNRLSTNKNSMRANLSSNNFRNIDNIDEYTPPSSVLNHTPKTLNSNSINVNNLSNVNHNGNDSDDNSSNKNKIDNNKNNSDDIDNEDEDKTNKQQNNSKNNDKNNSNVYKKFSPMFGSGSYLVGKSGGEGISIYSLAIAQDASFVLSGSTERAIRGWDVRSGQKIFKLKGHTDNIRSILLNPNSTRCLSASSDGTVRLWDIGEQRCIQVFDDLHTDSVWTLAANDSFSHFFSGGRDGMVFLTDLKTNQSRLVCREREPILKILNNEHDESIWVSTTGSTIKNYGLSNFYDKNQSVIDDCNTGGILYNTNNDGNNCKNKTIGPTLSTINEDSNRVEVEEPKIKIQGRAGIIKNQILNNRRHILTKDNDNNVQLWDITRGKEIESFGKVDFEKKLEEFNEVISIPKWFQVDCKTGSLFVSLESPSCFSATAYPSNLGFTTEDPYINVGENILYSLFSKYSKEYNLLQLNGTKNNNLNDSNDSVDSSLSSNTSGDNVYNNSNLQKSSSSSLVSTNSTITTTNRQKMVENSIFQLPSNTDVVISDETSGSVLYRSKIEEFTGGEQIKMINWLYECLTKPPGSIKRESQKISFFIENIKKQGILNASYFSQVRKICDHIFLHEFNNNINNNTNNNTNFNNNSIENLPRGEEYLEICFQNKILLPHYTLGTIKSFFWKQNSPIPLTYRIKAQYKNEAELMKYLKQLSLNHNKKQ
ncbi:hypothetical protein RB653_002956 [Dictyostelium firmibasis]|uniref:WD40 repeat-like protein n=1 Tax=Dictyostelium firmibasis TaxID=79012 RepID=A0AAN7TXF9_9MYCE